MMRNVISAVALLAIVGFSITTAQIVPRVWDERELASFEVPLVHPERSPRHAPPDYYYRIPARPIYKSYPIYSPGKEPAGYMKWLEQQEPEVVFDSSKLKSDADW